MSTRRSSTRGRTICWELQIFVVLPLLSLGNIALVSAISPSFESFTPELEILEEYTANKQAKVVNLLPNGPLELYNYDFVNNSKASDYKVFQNFKKLPLPIL